MKIYFKIILITITTILLLWLGYIAFLAYENPPRTTGVMFHKVIDPDDKLGYVSKKQLSADFFSGGAYTNTIGARTSSEDVNNSTKTADVLTVGCSQVYGLNLPVENTFSYKLQELTGKKVLNFGVSGYGSVASLLRAQRHLDLNPKYVVMGFYYDHVVRNVSPCFPGYMLKCLSVPYLHYDKKSNHVDIIEPKDNESILSLTSKYYNYMDGLSGYSYAEDFYWKLRTEVAMFFNSSPYIFGRRNPGIDEQKITTEFLLTEFKNKFKEHDVELIIVYIPNYFGEKVEEMPQFISVIAEKLNIKVVNIVSELQEAKEKKIPIIIPDDGHLNAFAHNIIATKLASLIK